MRPSRRPDAPPTANLTAYWAGRVGYRRAWGWQRTLEQARRAGRVGDVVLLLEHPPTYTIGRRGSRDHLLIGEEELKARGALCLDVDRGGDITYHGPGQLVGYPILDLAPSGGDVAAYLRRLEEALIDLLAKYGIASGRVPGYTGVWIGEEKIAAIGVKVRAGITSHGFALNVSTDLESFKHIVPCGIPDKGVTSIERVLASAPPLPDVARRAAQALGRAGRYTVRWAPPGELETLLALGATVEHRAAAG